MAGQLSSRLPSAVLLSHFNEGTGTTTRDEIDQTRVGTIVDASWVDGMSGKALYWSGGGHYVWYAASGDWTLGNNYTLIQWVKFNSINSDSIYLSLAQGVSTASRFYIQFVEGKLRYAIFNSTNYDLLDTVFTFKAGRWYMIAITHSGTTLRQFVDGVQIGTRQTSYTVGAWNQKLDIGGDYSLGGSTNFRGSIDETCILKEALSAGQIRDLYADSVGRRSE
jgi:hypothetical protein